MSSEKKKSKQKINIEIDEKVSEGIYSNLAIINHSVSEFVIDFISLPRALTTPTVSVVSRAKGLPIASTFLPTAKSSESPSGKGCKSSSGASIFKRAISFSGAVPTTDAW